MSLEGEIRFGGKERGGSIYAENGDGECGDTIHSLIFLFSLLIIFVQPYTGLFWFEFIKKKLRCSFDREGDTPSRAWCNMHQKVQILRNGVVGAGHCHLSLGPGCISY